MEGKTVKVAAYGNPADADWARLLLEEHGIPSFLTGVTLGATHYAHMDGGIKLHVRQEDAELAAEVLTEARKHSEAEPQGDLEGKTRWELMRALGLFFVVWGCFALGVVGCLSMSIEAVVKGHVLMGALAAGVGLPLGAALFLSARVLVRTWCEFRRQPFCRKDPDTNEI